MNSALHPQLGALVREIDEATARAKWLAERAGDTRFGARPAPESWSAAECIAHLSLTTKAFLPLIDQAFANGTPERFSHDRRFRRDPAGWFLTWTLEPPFRIKMKTQAAFVPPVSEGRDEILAAFQGLQSDLRKRVVAAEGYDIGRLKVTSPFNARMRYNLLSTFSTILAHQRRHLWQAERAAGV